MALFFFVTAAEPLGLVTSLGPLPSYLGPLPSSFTRQHTIILTQRLVRVIYSSSLFLRNSIRGVSRLSR